MRILLDDSGSNWSLTLGMGEQVGVRWTFGHLGCNARGFKGRSRAEVAQSRAEEAPDGTKGGLEAGEHHGGDDVVAVRGEQADAAGGKRRFICAAYSGGAGVGAGRGGR